MTHLMTTLWRLLLIVAAATACAEVQLDPSPRSPPIDTDASSTAAPSPAPAQPPSQPSPPLPSEDEDAPPDAPEPFAVVITELRANGPDWIELHNGGSEAVDLGGLLLADAANDGSPKRSDGVRFAEGVSVEAGGYLLVLAGQAEAPGSLTDACDGLVATCVHCTFKLSDGDGDHVFLLDGDVLDGDDSVLAEARYPAQAAGADESYALGANDMWMGATPTPGAPND